MTLNLTLILAFLIGKYEELTVSKVWSFQRWLIAFFMAFLSVSYANASDQVQNQEMAKSKGKILVVMTNHSAYPTRSDKTGLWLTELTHFYDVAKAAGYDMGFCQSSRWSCTT